MEQVREQMEKDIPNYKEEKEGKEVNGWQVVEEKKEKIYYDKNGIKFEVPPGYKMTEKMTQTTPYIELIAPCRFLIAEGVENTNFMLILFEKNLVDGSKKYHEKVVQEYFNEGREHRLVKSFKQDVFRISHFLCALPKDLFKKEEETQEEEKEEEKEKEEEEKDEEEKKEMELVEKKIEEIKLDTTIQKVEQVKIGEKEKPKDTFEIIMTTVKEDVGYSFIILGLTETNHGFESVLASLKF
jgi:hypothetical protein